MPDYAFVVMVAVIVLTLVYFGIKYLHTPKDVGPSPWPSPPPIAEEESEPSASQDEVDLWVDVFKIRIQKDINIIVAAAEADRAVQQFLVRYAPADDDDTDDEDDDGLLDMD